MAKAAASSSCGKNSMPSKNRFFMTKSLDALQRDAQADHGLKRMLTLRDLVVLGIAGVVGTGVFVLTGQAASHNAGPAVALSFVVSAVAAALAGLCYAEMASMIAVAGSAYTYVYATLGELLAFIIGWDLILEYGVAAACVSSGWSGYAVSFVRHATGYALPDAWTQAPLAYNADTGAFEASGAWLNLPAVLILFFVTCVLMLGMRLSMRVTLQVVVVKLAVIALFLVCAAPFVDPAHWQPFVPDNAGSFGAFGWSGVLQAATMLFFAYCGFDAVSTAAQECRRPQRDIPIAMIGSLATAAILYVAVALVLTGVVPYQRLGVSDPMALGIAVTGHRWMALAVDIGALAGLTSVLMVQIFGQTRILFTMCQDGLLPRDISAVHPRWGTPMRLTALVGGAAALAGGALPITLLGELTSIGTLFAFGLVSLGVMRLRYTQPTAARLFRVPGPAWGVPLLSACTSGLLIFSSTHATMVRLATWMLVGLAFYFFYGRHHARLRQA